MKYQMLAAHKEFDDDDNKDSVDEKEERKLVH